MKYCEQQRSKKPRFEFKGFDGFTVIKDNKKNDYIKGIGDCFLRLCEMEEHIKFLKMVASQSEYKREKEIDNVKRELRRKNWALRSYDRGIQHRELREMGVLLKGEQLANHYLHETIKKIDEVLEKDGDTEEIKYILDTYYPKWLYRDIKDGDVE